MSENEWDEADYRAQADRDRAALADSLARCPGWPQNALSADLGHEQGRSGICTPPETAEGRTGR